MTIFDALTKSRTCITIAEVRRLIHSRVVRQGTKTFTDPFEEIRPLELESVFVGKKEISRIEEK